jgi:4-hydroxy-tetrahydrodipicolinate synthase
MEDFEYVVQNTDDDFNVFTGEDAQALAAKAVGGRGVISVASHIYGREIRKMYDDLDAGDVKSAGDLMRFLTPKTQALFMYPSPSPVKAVLNAQGYHVGDCRLPILSLNEEEKQTLAMHLGMEKDALLSSKARV